MTRKQLYHALKNNSYLAVRWISGVVTVVNCKIAIHGASKFPIDDIETRIQSYCPISFQEYIRIKNKNSNLKTGVRK